MSAPEFSATTSSVQHPSGRMGWQINIIPNDIITQPSVVAPTPSVGGFGDLPTPYAHPISHNHASQFGHHHMVHNGSHSWIKHADGFWKKNRRGIAIGLIFCISTVAIGVLMSRMYIKRKQRREALQYGPRSSVKLVTPSDYSTHHTSLGVVNPNAAVLASSSVVIPGQLATTHEGQMMTTVYQPMFIQDSDDKSTAYDSLMTIEQVNAVPVVAPVVNVYKPKSVVHKAFASMPKVGGAGASCFGGRCNRPAMLPGAVVTHMGSTYRGR